jgi:hypothetical protein
MPASGNRAERGGSNPSGRSVAPLRWLQSFGRFWWNFLVGDTPELFVAVVITVAVTALLAKNVSTTAAWVTMPVMVVTALVLSVLRGRRAG